MSERWMRAGGRTGARVAGRVGGRCAWLAFGRVAGLVALGLCGMGASAGWAGGRLLATDGATQIEGSAGGGLVPWAVITGTGTEDQIGGSAFATGVFVDDYTLASFGIGVGLYDRVELSFAHQRFEVRPLDETLEQNVFGLKVRAFGDLVYGSLPVVSVGAQAKHNLDFDLPRAVGADDDWGIDVYVSATKLFLDVVAGRNVLLNGTVRATRANQIGLLGFGGDDRGEYGVVFEGSAAIFLTRRIALGYEFRQKRRNLSFADEDPWQDVFLAIVPNKHFKVVASYARLGQIAGFGNQDGAYLSIQGSF